MYYTFITICKIIIAFVHYRGILLLHRDKFMKNEIQYINDIWDCKTLLKQGNAVNKRYVVKCTWIGIYGLD